MKRTILKSKNRNILTMLLTGTGVMILGMLILLDWGLSKSYKTITIGTAKIRAEIADREDKRSQGLSGREPLKKDEGMVFVFPVKGIYPFWMKDMKFALDFIWIDANTVVDLTQDVPAPAVGETNLKLYSPLKPVDRVIEVNAGFIDKHAIKVGDSISAI